MEKHIKVIKFERGKDNINYVISSLVGIINRYKKIEIIIKNDDVPKIEKELLHLKK